MFTEEATMGSTLDNEKDSNDGSIRSTPLSPPVAALLKSVCVTGVIPRSGPLNEAVAAVLSALDVSCTLQRASELIELGAVWARMETLTQDEMLAMYDGRTENTETTARVMYADLPKGWGAGVDDRGSVKWQQKEIDEDLDTYVQTMQEQRFRRILTPSWMEAGIDLRIYTVPRRFPACYDMNRETSLLYEDTTFIVVDKPPMLPTQPDASNYIECCPACVEQQLGPFYDIEGNLVVRPLLCHRVDSCVGGCVVLSKDRNGQRVFHELQRERKLRKIYLAVTTTPVPTGMHVHWMWAGQSARGSSGGPPCQLVSHTLPESRRKARQFWNRCVLEVVSCAPIQITAETAAADGHNYVPPSGDVTHYQSTIRLVTGRKHQVRSQLASLGCPIIRDTLYEPISGRTLDDLEAAEHDMDASIFQCRVPTEPIGLQAAGILFGGIKARARTPWWGDRVLSNATGGRSSTN
jgi:23S rRNA-/tRNA-specific pseudouridylate synthase